MKTNKQTKSFDQELFNAIVVVLSQVNIAEVSEASGVHYTTLYSWINGTTSYPHLVTLLQVAEVIGITLTVKIPSKYKRRK